MGKPGVTASCAPAHLRSEGRVGDAWVACETTREDIVGDVGSEVLLPRLLAWCVEVVDALNES